MQRKEIFESLDRILEEWDPLGVLQDIRPLSSAKGSIGEYTKYVEEIIKIYVSKKSLYDYLVQLQTNLWDYPTAEMKEEIQQISDKILDLLSSASKEDLNF